MSNLLEKTIKLDNKKAKRCPDYDQDCHYVKNVFNCWQGGEYEHENGIITILEPVDGYCPFVIGMEHQKRARG